MVEYPKINEVVVCKINKITDFGVFVDLLEYEGLEGFVHVSQISSTWVKNIHNHAKINQIRAAKVLSINTSKNQIDISFNRVSPADEKRKISDFRLYKRALGLMNIICEELNITQDEAWEKIGNPIISEQPNLYTGFVNFLKYGDGDFLYIPKNYLQPLRDVLSKNISIKDKKITAILEISCDKDNGIDIIKNALLSSIKDVYKANIIYKGSGKYELIVHGIDYKVASKDLKFITDKLSKSLKDCELNIIENKNKK